MNRADQLIEAAREFTRQHRAWVDNANRGPHVDLDYWDAAESLIETFQQGGIPYECRQLSELVDAFHEQVRLYDEQGQAEPSDSFWAAREAIERWLINSKKPRPRRETVQELHAQKVGYEQIARMWGLVDEETGVPRVDLVVREIEQPGSVIGPDYVHPDDRAEQKRLRRELEALPARKHVAPAKPCPETPRELHAQGVSVVQAASMLLLPIDEVERMFAAYTAEDEQRKREEAAGLAPGQRPAPPRSENQIPPPPPSEPASPAEAGLEDDPFAEPEPDTEEDDGTVDGRAVMYQSMTIRELRELCEDRGIALTNREKKGDVIALLIAWEDQNADDAG